MKTNTTSLKFSDIGKEKNIELLVGNYSNPPVHFNIYDESRSDFFMVTLLIQGEVKIKLNLKEQEVSQNCLLFIVPNTLNQLLHASADVKLSRVIFTSKFLLQAGINQQDIDMIDFNSRLQEGFLTLNNMEAERLKKTIEDLEKKNEMINEHPYGEDILRYSFKIFLKELAGIAVKYNPSGSQKLSRKQVMVMQFENLINSNFKENRSVKFYADQLSITPKYLTEIVQEIRGESASVLIDEKVMYEAKVLLNNPRLTIAQIAEKLNFSDQSFLGKFFKRHLGLSPSQYRNHKLA